jgi:hypothetical protein
MWSKMRGWCDERIRRFIISRLVHTRIFQFSSNRIKNYAYENFGVCSYPSAFQHRSSAGTIIF